MNSVNKKHWIHTDWIFNAQIEKDYFFPPIAIFIITFLTIQMSCWEKGVSAED